MTKPNKFRDTISGSHVSRRRLIGALSAAGVAGIAGCMGGDDEDLPEGVGDGSGYDSDGRYFRVPEWTQPDQLQYNPYNPTSYGFDVMMMVSDQLMWFDPPNDDYRPQLADDWEIDENGLTLHLSDQYTWHDGDDFTAEDVYTKLRLEYHINSGGGSIWRYLESVDVEDDRTLYFTFDGAVNPALFERSLLELRIETKRDVYGEYLEPLESAELESGDHDDALADVLEFAPEEPVGTGPFEYADANPEAVYLNTYEDHFLANSINFDGYSFLHYPTNESRWTGFQEDELDGFSTIYVPEHILENFPDYVMEKRIPADEGLALYFQHDNDHFADTRVRRAFAFAIDQTNVAGNAGEHIYEPVSHPTGLSLRHTDEYLGDVLDSFTNYEQDLDRAAELLEAAGYERDGDDMWVDENGDTIEVEIRGPAGFSDWIDALTTVDQQLNQFGIDSTLNARDDGAYWADDWEQGQFDVAVDFYGSKSHPYMALEPEIVGHKQDNHNGPDAFDVPPLSNPDGDAETFDFDEKLGELERAVDEESERQVIQELAFAYNQAIPVLPIAEKLDQAVMTTHDWEIPDADDPIMEIPFPAWYIVREEELRLSE
ncbi:ABC transporter substrate-binding protein [Haloferacaceae archaeon DSL9]